MYIFYIILFAPSSTNCHETKKNKKKSDDFCKEVLLVKLVKNPGPHPHKHPKFNRAVV